MSIVDGTYDLRVEAANLPIASPHRRAISGAAAEVGRVLGAVAVFTAIMASILAIHAGPTLSSFHSSSAALSALLGRF